MNKTKFKSYEEVYAHYTNKIAECDSKDLARMYERAMELVKNEGEDKGYTFEEFVSLGQCKSCTEGVTSTEQLLANVREALRGAEILVSALEKTICILEKDLENENKSVVDTQ